MIANTSSKIVAIKTPGVPLQIQVKTFPPPPSILLISQNFFDLNWKSIKIFAWIALSRRLKRVPNNE